MEVKEKSQRLKEAEVNLKHLYNEFLRKEQTLLDAFTKEERIILGHPLKSIALLDDFKANGNEYIIRDSLSIARFEQFEILQVRVGYGIDFNQLYENMVKCWDYLNKSKPANASIILHNMMNGVANELNNRRNEVLLLCALFICRKDEDQSKYDEKLSLEKIKDWEEEGIEMKDFFSLAFSLVNNFIPVLNKVSKSISEMNGTLKETKEKD